MQAAEAPDTSYRKNNNPVITTFEVVFKLRVRQRTKQNGIIKSYSISKPRARQLRWRKTKPRARGISKPPVRR